MYYQKMRFYFSNRHRSRLEELVLFRRKGSYKNCVSMFKTFFVFLKEDKVGAFGPEDSAARLP